jgi:hypothetical protein
MTSEFFFSSFYDGNKRRVWIIFGLMYDLLLVNFMFFIYCFIVGQIVMQNKSGKCFQLSSLSSYDWLPYFRYQ